MIQPPCYLPAWSTLCYYLVDGFGLTVWSGNLRNMSPRWSRGAVIKPTTVSKGGLSGAIGWLREGTNALVRPNDFAMRCASASVRELSRFIRSSISSSLMCRLRSSIRLLSVGMNSGVPAFSDWKVLSFSFTYTISQVSNRSQKALRHHRDGLNIYTIWCSSRSLSASFLPFSPRYFSRAG